MSQRPPYANSHLRRGLSLPPEIEEGNVEYKLKISPPNLERLEQLTSQLKWRLSEHGQCFYEIG